jgi:hypothetical protein
MKKIDDVWTSHAVLSAIFGNHKPNSKASSNNIANLPNTMQIMHKPLIHIKIKLIIMGIILHQIVSKRNEIETMVQELCPT